MTEIVAKLSKEAVIVLCLLFAPPGEQEVLLDVIRWRMPSDNLVAIRTDTGFEVFEVRGAGNRKKRRVFTITAVKDRPFVFELKDRFNKDTRIDFSRVGKAIKPFKEAPQQRFKIHDSVALVAASGKIVYVHVQGTPVTYVVHGSGRTDKPKPSATTQPSPTTQPSTKKSGKEVARQFWAAFAKADLKTMNHYYADKVTIKYFSHLLKKRFGVVPENRTTRDATIEREKVISGYRKMLAEFGKDKWVEAYAKIKADKITITTAKQDGEPFAGVKKGDVVLEIDPVPGEGLIFIFRPDEKGRIRIVAEKNDY